MTEATSGWFRRGVIRSSALGLGGMVLGALVGIAVQEAVASTGMLGPGLDVLIDEQNANFERIQSKLAELAAAEDLTTSQALAAELESLIAEQEELAHRAQDELRGARTEIARLKEEALEATGTAGGANLWLGIGESVTVGAPGNVLGLLRIQHGNDVRVNVSGEVKEVLLGDFVEFPVGESTIRVFYKQAKPRQDGRVGFDVVLADAE